MITYVSRVLRISGNTSLCWSSFSRWYRYTWPLIKFLGQFCICIVPSIISLSSLLWNKINCSPAAISVVFATASWNWAYLKKKTHQHEDGSAPFYIKRHFIQTESILHKFEVSYSQIAIIISNTKTISEFTVISFFFKINELHHDIRTGPFYRCRVYYWFQLSNQRPLRWFYSLYHWYYKRIYRTSILFSGYFPTGLLSLGLQRILETWKKKDQFKKKKKIAVFACISIVDNIDIFNKKIGEVIPADEL